MKKRKLTPAHPLYQKVEKLEKFMAELGIEMNFDGYHMVARDTKTGVEAYYRDGESGEDVSGFPYGYEMKLVIE